MRPELLTVATLLLLEVHEMLLSVALLGDTVAVSCLVSPIFIVQVVALREILVT